MLFPIPGTRSYRGRLMWLLAVYAGLLTVAALVGGSRISQLGTEQEQQLRANLRATASLSNARSVLQNVEHLLHGLLQPHAQEIEAKLREALRLTVEVMRRVRELHRTLPVGNEAVHTASLVSNATSLRDAGLRLIQTRASVEQWFPSTTIMRELLLPANVEVNSQIEQLISAIDDDLTGQAHYDLEVDLLTLRQVWAQITGEMRLLVANRFGIFDSNPTPAMNARDSNVKLLLARANDISRRIDTKLREADQEFLAETAMHSVRGRIASWRGHYQTLLQELSSPGWRRDLLIMEKEVNPLLTALRMDLDRLNQANTRHQAQQLTRVTQVTENFYLAILGLLALGLAVIALGYLMFERNLIRPLSTTTKALLLEAKGESAPAPESKVKETEALISAFEELRRQVRAREQRLNYLAHFDALTGLPNRFMFRLVLRHELSAHDEGYLGVLYIDLDNFKPINDNLGHQVGDQVLIDLAKRMVEHTPGKARTARLSGDEFAVVIPRIKRREELARQAETLLTVLQDAVHVDGHDVRVSASIGISVSPDDHTERDTLLRYADNAMYEAKRRGKGRYWFFTKELGKAASEILSLQQELERALKGDELETWFQPIVDIQHTQPIGYEALLRWQHPSRGLLLPGQFMHGLTTLKMQSHVAHLVLEQVSQQLSRLAGNNCFVSFNLSAKLLVQRVFVDDLLDFLEQDAARAQRVVIEITEDSLTADVDEAAYSLGRLQHTGAKIALDDFGTGQSSLNHLKSFRFDMLKIDRSFVRDLPDDLSDAKLVKAAVQLGRAFGMRVVGEGVETDAQHAFLLQVGCDAGQGFLYARPTAPRTFAKASPESAPEHVTLET